MAVPNLFRGGGAITSYNFTDILAGTGVQTFYGGFLNAERNGTLVSGMVLLDNPFYSDDIVLSVAATGTGTGNQYVDYLDLDFDLSFNTPRIVNGDILLNLPTGLLAQAPSVQMVARSVITLYHVNSSGVETFLISGMTLDTGSLNTVNSTKYYNMRAIRFPITNKVFKKDEKLRLNTVLQCRINSNDNARIGYGIDPQNRNDDDSTPVIADSNDTNLILKVPFKLEVDV